MPQPPPDTQRRPPTHAYTSVRQPENEGGKFRKLLAVGSTWRDDDNQFETEIDQK
jgi:hypothetical protein